MNNSPDEKSGSARPINSPKPPMSESKPISPPRKLAEALTENERLQHIIECADTPLMRDVMAERDKALIEIKSLWTFAGHLAEYGNRMLSERDEALTKNKRLQEALTPDAMATAMQGVWNDWVNITGEIPADFRIHGPGTTRVSADFSKGNFADLVSEQLMELVLEDEE